MALSDEDVCIEDDDGVQNLKLAETSDYRNPRIVGIDLINVGEKTTGMDERNNNFDFSYSIQLEQATSRIRSDNLGFSREDACSGSRTDGILEGTASQRQIPIHMVLALRD